MTELENGITKLGCVNHDCEKCKAKVEQEPVIDKSAAIRIATSLGWTPQRTWVGLTGEDEDSMTEVIKQANKEQNPESFARGVLWAEAKLKEKNT